MAANTVQSILTGFRTLRGSGCVIGQFTEIQGQSVMASGGEFGQLLAQTGKYVGLMGGDLWYFSDKNENGSIDDQGNCPFLPLAIDWHNAGGLVTLILSWPNPISGNASQAGFVENVDLGNLWSNARFQRQWARVKLVLRRLKAEGVPVGLRIFHEFTGTWFFWGAQNDPAGFVKLWQQIVDDLRASGLSNVYMVWSPNAGFNEADTIKRYPGASYVDVVGPDFYSDNPAGIASAISWLKQFNKPIWLCEWGAGDPGSGHAGFDLTVLLNALKGPLSDVTAVQVWWERWGLEKDANAKALMNSDWIITRDEAGAIFGPGASSPPAGTTPPVSKPPTSGSGYILPGDTRKITDSKGNVWGIDASGTVTLAGKPIPEGAGTAAGTLGSDGYAYFEEVGGKLFLATPPDLFTPVKVIPGVPAATAPPATPPPATPPPATPPPASNAAKIALIRAKVATLRAGLTDIENDLSKIA